MNARVRDYLALTKPGITRHVCVTAAAGFYLGTDGRIAWGTLAALLAGTALVSGGTNALNQWWERDVDALMPRTASRPLAAGRLDPDAALGFGLALGLDLVQDRHRFRVALPGLLLVSLQLGEPLRLSAGGCLLVAGVELLALLRRVLLVAVVGARPVATEADTVDRVAHGDVREDARAATPVALGSGTHDYAPILRSAAHTASYSASSSRAA